MVARVRTVAFQGIEAVPVEAQVTIASGLPAFTVVGLPDKAVAESRERVRAALGRAGPRAAGEAHHRQSGAGRSAQGRQPFRSADRAGTAGGDGRAAGATSSRAMSRWASWRSTARCCRWRACCRRRSRRGGAGQGLICPAAIGRRGGLGGRDRSAGGAVAAGAGQPLQGHAGAGRRPSRGSPRPGLAAPTSGTSRARRRAKRALEVAAAGGHNLLMIGPPGAGKSMLAPRLPGLLPPLDAGEALEVSMVHSVAGLLRDGKLMRQRPFRDPHHSASLPALVGGGLRGRPGEVSLAHLGVLFLDELPEFQRATLEALRQPLESGRASVARVNAHVTYPARVQLVAAMNPCRCGHLDDPALACGRRRAARRSISRGSPGRCSTASICISTCRRSRPPISRCRRRRKARPRWRRASQRRARDPGARAMPAAAGPPHPHQCRARRRAARRDGGARCRGPRLLDEAAERLHLSARGYHRVLRVARTLADLDASAGRAPHPRRRGAELPPHPPGRCVEIARP